MQEKQTIIGDIYSISKDKKSISILGNWYRNFTELKFNKGDNVKIEFTENEKDGKTYRNISNIELIEKEPEWSKEIDSNYPIPSGIILKSKKEIDTTTINTIIMAVRDCYINSGKDMKETAKELLECYKIITS